MATQRRFSREFGKRAARTLLWSICLATPIAWHQYARGYSIPSREPPAAELDVQSTPIEASAMLETQSTTAPVEAAGVESPAADPAAAAAQPAPEAAPTPAAGDEPMRDAVGDNAAAQPVAPSADAVPAEESTDRATLLSTEQALAAAVPAAEPAAREGASQRSVGGDRAPSADVATDALEPITIVVSEPRAEESAPAAADAAQSIHEVLPAPKVKPQAVAPKPKRAARKARRSLVVLLEPEVTPAAHVRALTQAEPTPAREQGQKVPPLIGGRGVAARADLGRASPLTGAAPDVFATGHHVASAATCDAYADNAYLREDAFGRTLGLSCD